MTSYAYVESPLGRILLTSNGRALNGLYFEGQRYEPRPAIDWVQSGHSLLFASAAT